MSSTPPPGWSPEDPVPDPPAPGADEAIAVPLEDGQLGSATGSLPAEQLEDMVRRLKARRAAHLSPSRWETMGEKGVAGEKKVAAVLERELKGSATVLLYSQKVARPVGDIDAIVIGPGGVTVIDSKHWGGTVVVDRDRILRQNGRVRHEKVDGMLRQRRAIKLALVHARPELRNTRVREVICLADEESRPVEALTGGVVLCGAVAAAEIAVRDGTLTPSDIDEIRVTLLRALPALTTADFGDGRPVRAPKSPTSQTRVRGVTRGQPRRSSGHRRGSSRRRRSAVASIGSLLAAGLLIVIALELRHVVARAANPPTLVVTSQAGRSVLYMTAPAGDRVELRVSAGASTHFTHLVGIGTARRWVVPRAWSRAPWITVSACVANSTGACTSSSVSASNEFS